MLVVWLLVYRAFERSGFARMERGEGRGGRGRVEGFDRGRKVVVVGREASVGVCNGSWCIMELKEENSLNKRIKTSSSEMNSS